MRSGGANPNTSYIPATKFMTAQPRGARESLKRSLTGKAPIHACYDEMAGARKGLTDYCGRGGRLKMIRCHNLGVPYARVIVQYCLNLLQPIGR